MADLSGRSICVSSDTFADFMPGLRNSFEAAGLRLNARSVRTRAESEQLFFAGQCIAVTADASELASAVLRHGGPAARYAILAEQITKEPLAALLRKGDDELYDAVRWSLFALINAEELGITRASLPQRRASADRETHAFFAAAQQGRGLAPAWTAALVSHLGNYGELYQRHLGASGLPRGLNRLWTQGGLLYAPPLR